MILGRNEAQVSDSEFGVTLRNTAYPIEINGKKYTLHDTAGLGQCSGGTVEHNKAIGNIYRLVTELSTSGGVNLLVFVIKHGRLTETMKGGYALFHHGFCDSKVPIVIVVTGCETVEPPMDAWWINNEPLFTEAKMSFEGHACVCAFEGTEWNGYRDKDLVEESRAVARRLVVQCCMSVGWRKVRNPHSQSL